MHGRGWAQVLQERRERYLDLSRRKANDTPAKVRSKVR